MKSACVFLPNWVGDAVMATPTLRALREHLGPQSRLVGIMKPRIEDVLRGTPWIDEVWLYDRESDDPHLRPGRLVKKLRRARFDLCLLMTNDFFSAFLAWAGRAGMRVGYARYRRGALLSRRLRAPRQAGKWIPVSALDYYLRLAYALGCPEQPPKLELATTGEDERRADRAWRALNLHPGKVVCMNSSGAYGAAKLWPDNSFAELARLTAEMLGYQVLFLCGPSESERAARIAHSANHPDVVSLAGLELSLGLSKACVRRGRLLVTTDSGPRHFAAAFGVPVIALFGPTHIAWSDTHYPAEIRLQIPVDCGPCQERECPRGDHKCMQSLTVDHVYRAVREALRAG
jgi:heptosyltransferase-2